MPIKSILVATNFSPQEEPAVLRARQLARAHDAALELADARRFEDLASAARGVDLVVLPHRRERSTAAFFRGQPVMRLLREGGSPVLVTRAPRRRQYERVLVAVDFTRNSAALARFAADFALGAQLEVFHAISTRDEAKLRSAEATELAISRYRKQCLDDARRRMEALAGELRDHGGRLLTNIGRGDPGRQAVLQQERSAAGLVVVGKTGHSAWGDFFCGSVAHSVLSWGTSDVLVVPDAYLQGRQAAPARVDRPPAQRAFGLQPAAARRSS